MEHSLSFSCDYMQTNATVIDAMLKSYQGVIAASTGTSAYTRPVRSSSADTKS